MKRTSPFLPIFIMGLLYATWFVLRYGGLWTENDTSMFGYVTEQVLNTGSFVNNAYTHGFGYQDWLASLCLSTGLSVPLANTIVAPFLGMVLCLIPCYLTYTFLLNSERAAAFATLLLFIVPELMFSILRGNHEKLSISLFAIGIYLLFKGMESLNQVSFRSVVFWIIMYYCTVCANAAVNDYFASTVVFANLPVVAFVHILYKRRRHREHSLAGFRAKYFTSVVTAYLVVLFVMFFVYPQSGQDFLLAQTIAQKVQDLFLTLKPTSDPYSVTTQAWAGGLVGHVMASFRQLLLGLSFVSFLYNVWMIYVAKRAMPLHRYLLLAEYVTYGCILAISIPVDFAGAGVGSNLEVRNYTYLSLIAAPMLAVTLFQFVQGSTLRLFVFRPIMGIVLSIIIVMGLTKSTLDPIVSNDWIFYSRAERQALVTYLQNDTSGVLWTGPDNRITNLATLIGYPYDYRQNEVVGFDITFRPQIMEYMWSPFIKANLLAQQLPAPNLSGDNRILDDGKAQIYHVRPTTVFQQLE